MALILRLAAIESMVNPSHERAFGRLDSRLIDYLFSAVRIYRPTADC